MGDCLPIPCDPLETHGFKESIGESILILFAIGMTFHILAMMGMYFISNPKRPTLNTVES